MKDGFDIDNPFFAFMGALADIVIVNLLFIACSIPVLTMGASLSAMYQTMRQMREKRMASAFRSFTGAFCRFLKKSIPAWIVQLVSGIVLFFDLAFAGMMPKTIGWNLIGMATGGMLLIWTMMSCYLFPAAVYNGKKLKQALAQCLYLAVRNLPYTVMMAVLNSIPFVCIWLGAYFIGVVTPVYILAGFGITAYLNTMLLGKCRDLEILVNS